ncbi:epimerase [Microbacterium sp. Root53]|uniref:NAD-dependent epimerase/dehydratase family protein n=1 Tax=Microbacterium sp. Root53 TaxID=1736553 RepID=UPI0006F73A2A|nr:NAD-dependent epimerase/dehydratase family protein [Microbacterium sp. Root53]KQY98584.1 epimerase [Microbacterium sp. Root53]
MKVAIVGASGNTGTALLHALRDEPAVDAIVGIARRTPEAAPPYDAAHWERIDIAAPAVDRAADERVIDRLAAAFRGVDCVVHLAWLIQPNRKRELIRRANVDGTRRVIEACLRAGVRHLVCASSVGAYTGVDDDDPRDESWPTEGIPTSHYAADKAAQERLLDDAETRGLAVARLRPALVFDRDAGAEITRLFVGALLPPALLRPGRLPVVPLPAGVRMQVVHGADLADAYRRVIVGGATGAFNIAADPVLRGRDIAAVLAHGRQLAVPARVLRPLLHAAWRLHTVAADPGWLDMAMTVPIMDSSRARRELGWQPRHDATSALRELLTGMADGAGTASAPMRPRRDWPQDQLPPGDVLPDGPAQPPADSPGHRLPATLQRDILGLYLSDHLTGATAGVARFRRMAKAYADTDLGPDLARLAEEVGRERVFLKDLVDTLEVPRRPHRQALAWLGEKAGRLKTNGRPLGSPMTPVLETELMRGAVMGKKGVWETLAALAPDLGLPAETFTALAERAEEQAAVLGRLHRHIVREAFVAGHVD